jgi:hypothetical protein
MWFRRKTKPFIEISMKPIAKHGLVLIVLVRRRAAEIEEWDTGEQTMREAIHQNNPDVVLIDLREMSRDCFDGELTLFSPRFFPFLVKTVAALWDLERGRRVRVLALDRMAEVLRLGFENHEMLRLFGGDVYATAEAALSNYERCVEFTDTNGLS